jgi:protein gp37
MLRVPSYLIHLFLLESEVAFFFKQWGGKNKKKTGRELNGRTYDEMPIAIL